MEQLDQQRRDALKAAILAALGLACLRAVPVWSAPTKATAATMLRRKIPGHDEQLPVIGIGVNFFGGTVPDDLAVRRELMRQMAELDMAIVDTAQAYGQTETVLGGMLAELGVRDRLFLSTKLPLGGDAASGDAAIETSLRALRVQRIDLMMVHNLYRFDDYLPALERAREARRIRYLGATASVLQLNELKSRLRKHRFDFIQVGYSLGNRLAEPVIAEASARGIAVLVGEPFGGRRRAESMFATVRNRPLPDWAAEIDARSWAQVMLKYILSLPGVLAVTPGTDSLPHLADNLAAGYGRLPDASIRREMERYWDALRAKK